MVATPSVTPFAGILPVLSANFPANEVHAISCRTSLSYSLRWISHFLNSDPNNPASRIGEAAYSAAVEATTLVSLGLMRSAVLSLRSHYEFSLMYLYYKDHPVELESAIDLHTQFDLPGEIKKYLKRHYPEFEKRWSVLLAKKTRADDDLYGKLSSVAHGSAVHSLPHAKTPPELIVVPATIAQIVPVFDAVSENISDYCVATFKPNWLSIFKEQRDFLVARIGPKAKDLLLFH